MDKISIILPAYKRRFLREAIASILAQSYRDFELVIVDDASPENLEEVVRAFQDSRMTYFRNAANLGGKDLIAAWNQALSYATGEWVVLASDDDLYAPRFLETMVGLVEKYPTVDLVHSRVRIVDGEGRVLGVTPPKPELESALELAYHRIVGKADQYVPEFMFRRSRLKEIGGFVSFPKAWYSDEATWILMAEKGCANCNESLFSFRYSGINISTSFGKVFDLVEAGRLYYEWATAYFAGCDGKSVEEQYFLHEIRMKLECRVVALIFVQMARTGWREWCHVMRRSKISRRWKLRILKDALLRGIGVR